jgi:TonB-linked outer membrane protein, SusC/RagA family
MKKKLPQWKASNNFAFSGKLFAKRASLRTILCLVLLLGASAMGFAQNVKLTLNVKNTPIKEVLKQIEEKTGYSFMYDNKKIDVNRTTSLNVKDKSVDAVLDIVFSSAPINVRVVNKQIILTPANERAEATPSKQQGKAVKGKVTDEKGETLPGVSISIKGSTIGTATDVDGKYSIPLSDKAQVLVFSYVGMASQEVFVKAGQEINVVMKNNAVGIEEVVVVGYGTQKKANLTGAVKQISSKELENRPIINVGQGLQGAIPNLNVTIASGKANELPSLNIRGVTSITSGGSPLIVIDGVPATVEEFMAINTNDIGSISTLMDAASSAIYGSKAAFGVVLVTTKNAGNEDIRVDYSTNLSFRKPTIIPEFIMEQNKVMRARVAGTGGWYSLKDIYGISDWDYLDKVTKGELPQVAINPEDNTKWLMAGRTNWYKEAMRDYGITQNHNVSVSGKSKKTSYYFSGGYSEQDGVFKYGNDIFNKYNFRGKIDFDVTKWLTISNNSSYNYDNYNEPSQGFSFGGLMNTPTLDLIKNPDGSWTSSGASIFGSTIDGGRSVTKNSRFWTSFTANAHFFDKMLTITARSTVMRSDKGVQSYWLPVVYKSGPDKTGEMIHPAKDAKRTNYGDNQNVFDLYADFDKSFNKHHIHALVGYNQEYRYSDWFSALRKNLISGSVPSIDLAIGDQEVHESISEWTTRSGFARLNYDYDGKYLVEVDGRYDGSSRFPKKDRFCFVPSFSLGWNLAKESFFAPLENIVTTLKPRFSYGTLGNQEVGPYDYLPTMGSGKISSILAGNKLEQQTTIYAPGLVSPSLTWEKVRTTNYGIDFGVLNNRLTGTFDYYHRATIGMLTGSKMLPGVLGTSEPRTNAADLMTKGWELSLSWKDSFKLLGSPFGYNLGFTLADSRAWITKFDNPQGLLGQFYNGYEFGEIWGFEVDGLFQKGQELANHANQGNFWSYPDKVIPGRGDIKFNDLNGDGQIRQANTVNDRQDQRIIGNSRPRYTMGIRGGFDWQGFDFSTFVQGVLKRDWYPTSSNFWGLNQSPWTNLQKYQYENTWTPENPDAYMPRLKGYAASGWSGAEMLQANTRYLQNAAYVRLKNISLGYSFPTSLISKIKLNQLRISVSGENLLTWTGIKNPNIDPETLGDSYPMQKLFSFGINVKF